MYPWYRESQIGVGQFCSPMSATIKTESGYNDCMLALDYAAQSKVNFFITINKTKIGGTATIRQYKIGSCFYSRFT